MRSSAECSKSSSSIKKSCWLPSQPSVNTNLPGVLTYKHYRANNGFCSGLLAPSHQGNQYCAGGEENVLRRRTRHSVSRWSLQYGEHPPRQGEGTSSKTEKQEVRGRGRKCFKGQGLGCVACAQTGVAEIL